MKTDKIRKLYLEYFKSRGHEIMPSDSLVPEDDPTLLFTSAGMNQFKMQFMGKNISSKRVTTCQKCLRTGDLDKVGKTPYHHTFFEMLGNFSFGDYFKKEAIGWAWDFLINTLKMQPESLWVSVYKDDKEALDIWKKDIEVPDERIFILGDKDNFWPQEAITKGPNGPCGPCSEIYFDKEYRKKGKRVKTGKGKKSQAEPDSERFVEVWNLVFTQYMREGEIGKKGRLKPLPNKNIDTGMGLERMAQVLQGVDTNFEIDVFKPIVGFIQKHTDKKYKTAPGTASKVNAVADHARAVVFAISDGVIPSNEERGYVIRKLIRRSRFMLAELGIEDNFLYKMVPVISKVMKTAYPQVDKRRENIAQIILEEENKFNELKQILPARKRDFISKAADVRTAGELAFENHDTYGIPLEITTEWARQKFKKGFNERLFVEHFEKNLQAQKDKSRQASQLAASIFEEGIRDIVSGLKPTEFTGYKSLSAQAKVIALIKNNKKVQSAKKGDKVQVVLNKTPFYAESGGQAGDRGRLISKGLRLEVKDTRQADNVYIHKAIVAEGTVKAGDKVMAEVEALRRRGIEKSHTATHLLQSALRRVLGKHVEQAGSLVDENRLRFDFTHFKQLTPQELGRIEDIVNGYIQSNTGVKTEVMNMSEAKKKGALSFFKEKYSDRVRVVTSHDESVELCGGTHADSTGSIGLFKIISESSIASGIRRIEALTGQKALDFINKEQEVLAEAAALLKTDKANTIKALNQLMTENKELKKRLNALNMRLASAQIPELIDKAKSIKGVKLIKAGLKGQGMDSLMRLSDMIKEKVSSAVIILASQQDNNKLMLLIGVTDDLIKKGLNANSILQKLNSVLGSKGGGRPNLAQAGGGSPDKLDKAFSEAEDFLKSNI